MRGSLSSKPGECSGKNRFPAGRLSEILGGAVEQVHNVLRTRYPTDPWRKMAGHVDVLIHSHFGVDIQRPDFDPRLRMAAIFRLAGVGRLARTSCSPPAHGCC
jgi:hypothetical protein